MCAQLAGAGRWVTSPEYTTAGSVAMKFLLRRLADDAALQWRVNPASRGRPLRIPLLGAAIAAGADDAAGPSASAVARHVRARRHALLSGARLPGSGHG